MATALKITVSFLAIFISVCLTSCSRLPDKANIRTGNSEEQKELNFSDKASSFGIPGLLFTAENMTDDKAINSLRQAYETGKISAYYANVTKTSDTGGICQAWIFIKLDRQLNSKKSLKLYLEQHGFSHPFNTKTRSMSYIK